MKDAKTAPLSASQLASRALMLQQVSEDSPARLGHFEAVYASRASPRRAIKAKCLECCWMDSVAIRECEAAQCPLWEFRPFQWRAK